MILRQNRRAIMSQKIKYKLRRDSLISPWGIGAIVPFPNDESFIIAGIDHWFKEFSNKAEFEIKDPRLSRQLHDYKFYLPPDYREKNQTDSNSGLTIPAFRFPLWHYCPVCGNMERLGTNGTKQRCSGEIRVEKQNKLPCHKSKHPPYLIPERFVVVCDNGHIQDFPYMEWVHAHSGKEQKADCKLVRSTGSNTSSLSGVKYKCTCGAEASMSDAFNIDFFTKHFKMDCQGNRPWLDDKDPKPCDCTPRVVQKGSSSVWFPEIRSSIFIPEAELNAAEQRIFDAAVKKYASSITNGLVDQEAVKNGINILAEFEQSDTPINKGLLLQKVVNKLEAKEQILDEPHFLEEEFNILSNNFGSAENELYVVNKSSSSYSNLVFLDSISLVFKLRETRALVGFKRLNIEGKISPLSRNKEKWYPAVKNCGEGIFLRFNYESLENWAQNNLVKSRVKTIEANLNSSGNPLAQPLNPIYVLLHTFSHCLITTLSNHSGYSNASIRERIYCDKLCSTSSPKMAGILIYTASGDSEGSLGGLVRQGKPGKIEPIIQSALQEAKWCASDPVCIQSSGQGLNGSNLAACHNCALLPETSCENRNTFLDRALLIGTLDQPFLGYFCKEATA